MTLGQEDSRLQEVAMRIVVAFMLTDPCASNQFVIDVKKLRDSRTKVQWNKFIGWGFDRSTVAFFGEQN